MSEMEKAVMQGSVFTADCLEALSTQNEPGGAEGELAGPWKVWKRPDRRCREGGCVGEGDRGGEGTVLS